MPAWAKSLSMLSQSTAAGLLPTLHAFSALATGPRLAARSRSTRSRSAPTGWREAEHGGFYQALADGTYRQYGLDVTIVPGGPNVNNRILLPVGKLDFFMSANTLQSFDAVAQNIPTARRRGHVPERPAGADGASRSGHREIRGPEAAHVVRFQGRARQLFPVAQGRFRIQRSEGEALHVQPATVPRRQAQRHAGLCHVGALRDREAGGISSRRSFCSPIRASTATRR